MSEELAALVQQIDTRLEELRTERAKLTGARAALVNGHGPSSDASENGGKAEAPKQPKRRRARKSSRRTSSAGRRPSLRRTQLLEMIRESPGITIAQAGQRMGLSNATSLYPMANQLRKDNLVVKQGTAYSPVKA